MFGYCQFMYKQYDSLLHHSGDDTYRQLNDLIYSNIITKTNI